MLTGTHEHPFWVEAEAAWVPLGELAEGDVLTTDGGGAAVVVGFTVRPGGHEVFNLEVGVVHNMYVRAPGSDEPGVLTHNQSGKWTPDGHACETMMGPFGRLWKSKHDGLWWSRDTAGHGNPPAAWKVFKESATTLDWLADADESGDYIKGKHKGPTGRCIPLAMTRGRRTL